MSEHFFIKISRPPQGETQQSPQKSQRIRPKGPQGPQKLRKCAEKQHRAPEGPRRHKQAHLPVPGHDEQEQAAYRQDAVGPIQHPAPHPSAQPPQGAEQVIDQPQARPQ